jgi:hypothetical protein
MPLPLLLGIGAGILGGAQYLMKKEDDRETESLLAQMQAQAPGTALGSAGYADPYLAAAQRTADNAGFFETSSDRVQSIYDKLLFDSAQYQQQQAQKQAERAWQMQQSSIGITDQLDQDYNRDLKSFGQIVQPAYRQAMAALENPNSADSVAALYNFFNIVEPGGRVTENEDGSFSSIGGAGAEIANWLNKMRGEGLSGATTDQIKKAIYNQFKPQYERAVRQRQQYERDLEYYGNQGYNVRSPIGRQGIDWTAPQVSSGGGGGPGVPLRSAGNPTAPKPKGPWTIDNLPPGFRVLEED